jgi:hypothetical protein
VSFDQVYGWEMTLLEPTDYWRRVPPRWKPYWHFHNIPVQSDLSHADSPLRYVRQLASPQDFVVRGGVTTVFSTMMSVLYVFWL